MAVYGYARVSTREQNLDRQLVALADFGVAEADVFADKATGANFERPAYRAMLEALSAGDLLVIASIDRLGRDYDEIQEQWRAITKVIGADVEVLDMPLLNTRGARGGLTGTFVADMVLQVLSYVAQMEREKIKQRQSEGIAAAKERGVKFGRSCIEVPDGFGEVLAAHRNGEMTRKEASKALGVSPNTFDKWRKAAS